MDGHMSEWLNWLLGGSRLLRCQEVSCVLVGEWKNVRT